MLEIRPSCENCNKELLPNSTEAMICSYECTFCNDCVETILFNVCPNCGGGFEKRPIRPHKKLLKDKPSTKVIHKPINSKDFKYKREELINISPENR